MASAHAVDHQLRSHPLIRGMEDGDVALLARHARLVEFAPHDEIFSAGGTADTFYLVRTGIVALFVEDGGAQRKIESLREGSALGWSWLFDPYEWHFGAVAETPVRAIALDAHDLRGAFDADAAFGYRLVARIAEMMAKRLYATRRQVVNLMGN